MGRPSLIRQWPSEYLTKIVESIGSIVWKWGHNNIIPASGQLQMLMTSTTYPGFPCTCFPNRPTITLISIVEHPQKYISHVNKYYIVLESIENDINRNLPII